MLFFNVVLNFDIKIVLDCTRETLNIANDFKWLIKSTVVVFLRVATLILDCSVGR